MWEKWKRGKHCYESPWKTIWDGADIAYSLLSREMTKVKKCRGTTVEFESRCSWLDKTGWGTGKYKSRLTSGKSFFANVYIYIYCWIVASPSVSCHRGAVWHHSASIYGIFSMFGYSPLFQLCIKNLSLLALSRNDRVGFFVLFFKDSHLSISSLFRVPTGKVFLTISLYLYQLFCNYCLVAFPCCINIFFCCLFLKKSWSCSCHPEEELSMYYFLRSKTKCL